MSNGQSKVAIVPLTIPKANALVTSLHRHHAALPGGFAWFCLGAVVDGRLAGCAIAGRPTNRNSDDGQTVEVLRVAADGTPNVPSALLGACVRAARAIGAARIITYTLDSESGISLRAAGWTREADGIKSWWTHPGKDGKGRAAAIARPHMDVRKVRWGLVLRERIEYTPLNAETAPPSSGNAVPSTLALEGGKEAVGNQPTPEASVAERGVDPNPEFDDAAEQRADAARYDARYE